ncbi:MAG: hypothetical protein ACXVKC_17755, partial [Candidatus Angelobacter sp.]
MKRAKLVVVVVSVLVLSSFALQNPAGTGQPVSLESKPGQSNPTQGVPQQGAPSQIFGFRDFTRQYQVDQQFLASPSPAR